MHDVESMKPMARSCTRQLLSIVLPAGLSMLTFASIVGAQTTSPAVPVTVPMSAASPAISPVITPSAIPQQPTTPSANATAGASGVTGSAGLQTGAVSPSPFGTTLNNVPNVGTAAGGSFNQTGAGFVNTPFNQPINQGINPTTVQPFAGSTVPSGSAVLQNPPIGTNGFAYPIYIPYPYAVGGGPAAPGYGAGFPAAQPGASASESMDAPSAAPRVNYRSVPGGRANTDLDDPTFRAGVTR